MAPLPLARSLVLCSLITSSVLALVACTGDDGGGQPNGGSSGSGGSGNGGGSGSGGEQSNAGTPATGGSNGAGSGSGGDAAGTGTGGNAAGAGGTGGSSAGGEANGGSSGSGGGGATSSPGCGTAAGQDLGKWVEQPKLDVAGTDRQWWIWLPDGYDPNKPYPLIFNFHGCGNSNNIVPMQNVAGEEAVLVRGTGISDNVCWDASPNGNDLTFFDQMLAEVVAKRCVDTSRVFATGYSSGSWLSNMLACERGDKLRAIGTVSGGTFGSKANCKGKLARIFVHDNTDHDNEITAGNDDERDRLIQQNNCMADTPPVMEEPAPCARYQGCDPGYPVIWCETTGKGHARQDDLAPGAFWKLFSSL